MEVLPAVVESPSPSVALPFVGYDLAATNSDSTSWIIISTPTSTTAHIQNDMLNRFWSMRTGDTEWRTHGIGSTSNLLYYPTTNTSTTTSINRDFWIASAATSWTTTEWNPTDWTEIREEACAPVVKKSTRNSIKRALKLMTGLGFEEDARIFLKGDSIEVSHPESLLKFVITKYDRSLIYRTENPGYSTPYRLELYTKSDVHVANLCVYMEETPLLDQVLGVAMFIKSGSEEMILSQANWSALTSDLEMREILALEYPYLKPKLRLNDMRFRH